MHERNTETGWEVNKETAGAFRKQWKKRRVDGKKRWTVVNTLTAEDRKKERVHGRDTEGKGETI